MQNLRNGQLCQPHQWELFTEIYPSGVLQQLPCLVQGVVLGWALALGFLDAPLNCIIGGQDAEHADPAVLFIKLLCFWTASLLDETKEVSDLVLRRKGRRLLALNVLDKSKRHGNSISRPDMRT